MISSYVWPLIAAAMARAVLIASEFSSPGSVIKMPRWAPIASARRIASRAWGGPIEMMVTSPPSFSTTCTPASTPCSSPGSSTRSTPSRTSRLVCGSSLPGAFGSGICLTQTSTFMAGFLHYEEIVDGRTNVLLWETHAPHRIRRDRGEDRVEPRPAHGIQLVAQPLSGLLSQLRLLLRPRSRQTCGPRSWGGLLGAGRCQGQRRRPAPVGAFAVGLEARDGRVWHRHRSVSAHRGQLQAHPPLSDGVPGLPDANRPHHQRDDGNPRYRCPRRAFTASEDDRLVQHSNHRRGGLGPHRAGDAAAEEAAPGPEGTG